MKKVDFCFCRISATLYLVHSVDNEIEQCSCECAACLYGSLPAAADNPYPCLSEPGLGSSYSHGLVAGEMAWCNFSFKEEW